MKLFKRKLSAKQKEALNRLADGIECGAKLRPQTQKKLIGILDDDNGENVYGSCALGAAWECAQIEQGLEVNLSEAASLGRINYLEILKAYGVTTQAKMKTVFIEDREITDANAGVDDLIIRLNDWLLWSRERIAQFLREVE